jgi:hypothetical protein
VTIAAPRTAWTWPVYIAMEAGYYDKYGLEVDLVFANHPAGVAMLVSGEAEVNLLPLQRALQLGSLDDSFTAIGTPVGKWLFALIAREEIANVQDLRGGRLGIAQVGDATYNYALALLAQFGLALQDVQLIVVGAEGRIPALASGQVDATMLSAPAYFRLEESGFRSLANISDYDDIHTPNVLLLRKSTVEARPELPELLLRAHAEAVKRFYDDRDFALGAHLVYDEQDVVDLGRVYDDYKQRNVLDRVPYIRADAIRYVVKAVPDPAIAARLGTFDYSSLIDNSAVDRLVGEGFFEELFGPEIRSEQDLGVGLTFRDGMEIER